jgi:hypothetical protein
MHEQLACGVWLKDLKLIGWRATSSNSWNAEHPGCDNLFRSLSGFTFHHLAECRVGHVSAARL